MKKKLIILFLVYVLIRLIFSLNSSNLMDDKSYYSLRQIENIKETGKPLHYDELSYGGRVFVIMPLYYYFMLIFSLIGNITLLKIIQNVLASTILIVAYFLCNRLFKNNEISIVCALLISGIQIYLEQTINTLNPISLVIPASLLLIYLFLDIKSNLVPLIVVTLIISTSSGISALIILCLLLYLLFNVIYNKKIEGIELEYISFYILFFLWTSFILFKNAFQIHGFEIIYQNIPIDLGIKLDFISFFINIGILSILFGSYSLYLNLVKGKNENLTIISSLLISISLLSWLGMISQIYAIIFMSVCFIILSGQFVKDLFIMIEKSKFSNYKKTISYLLIFFILLQFTPGIMLSNIKQYDSSYLSGFAWLNKNTQKNSTILAMPKDGHLISYLGKRKNVMDTEYLLINDVNIRYNDIVSFYDSRFKINSLRILNKYDAEYFIVYNESYYLDKDPCFSLMYLGDIKIYKKVCEFEE